MGTVAAAGGSMAAPSRRRRGLSQVELLVVIGIITVLVGLLVSGVLAASRSAQRLQCAAQLHQIGIAFQMYRDTADGRLPEAARLPSAGDGLPGIADVLGSHVEDKSAFRCPADNRYFSTEGTSYEYPGEFRSGGRFDDLTAQGRSSDRVWLLYDFDPVHGPRGSGSARNFLYADGHVSQ